MLMVAALWASRAFLGHMTEVNGKLRRLMLRRSCVLTEEIVNDS